MAKRKAPPAEEIKDESHRERKGGEADAASEIRNCLKMIRCLDTMPSDILPNGKSASSTAHEYVMQGKIKREDYKKKPPAKKLKGAH